VTTTVTTQASQDGTGRHDQGDVVQCPRPCPVPPVPSVPSVPSVPCWRSQRVVSSSTRNVVSCQLVSTRRTNVVISKQHGTLRRNFYRHTVTYHNSTLPISIRQSRVTELSLAQITLSQVTTCSQHLTASLPLFPSTSSVTCVEI